MTVANLFYGKVGEARMSYKGPIDIVTCEMQSAMENEIYSAVKRVGVNVDKAELLKALAYDREQYQKGYEDRDKEIVRCRDCKHRPTCPENKGYGQSLAFPDDVCPCQVGDNWYSWMPKDNWFCADGERLEDEDKDEL